MNREIFELLSETFNNPSMRLLGALNEAQAHFVNEQLLSKMFEAIGEKYNEIDFSEIEKCKGAFSKFKYKNLLVSNIELLSSLYLNGDSVSETMTKYTKAAATIIDKLLQLEKSFVELYDEAVIAVIFNTTVANLIYSTTLLISTTVRFLTVEKDADIEVLIDNLPNAEKYIFLKNLLKLEKLYEKEIVQLFTEIKKNGNKKLSETYSAANMNEAIMFTSTTVIVLTPIVILILWKFIPICREIIYAVYSMRISIENICAVQIELINTNIESLEERVPTNPKAKKKHMKVIARQKKVVEKLDSLKRFVAVKFDIADQSAKKEIARENPEYNMSNKEAKAAYNNSLMI